MDIEDLFYHQDHGIQAEPFVHLVKSNGGTLSAEQILENPSLVLILNASGIEYFCDQLCDIIRNEPDLNEEARDNLLICFQYDVKEKMNKAIAQVIDDINITCRVKIRKALVEYYSNVKTSDTSHYVEKTLAMWE